MTGPWPEITESMSARDKRITDLETQLATKDAEIERLKAALTKALEIGVAQRRQLNSKDAEINALLDEETR